MAAARAGAAGASGTAGTAADDGAHPGDLRGDPFYAVELARAMTERGTVFEAPLPGRLAELVRARIGNLDGDVQDVLLAAACVAAPSVGLVGRATDIDVEQVVELLAKAESNGIVTIEGHRLRFAHPLLDRGVYTHVAPARRRSMHRRLAEVVDDPELRARHLALAATSGDHETIESLDAAPSSCWANSNAGCAKRTLPPKPCVTP